MAIFDSLQRFEEEYSMSFPSILEMDTNHQEDAEHIKKHFCEHKESIQESLKDCRAHTRHISMKLYHEHKILTSFLKRLLYALEALDSIEESGINRIAYAINRYHNEIQKILNFEQSTDFELLQNTIGRLLDYGDRLNSAILLFPNREWEDILETLMIIDDIEHDFQKIIRSTTHYKREYEDIIKDVPENVKDALQKDPHKIPEQESSVINNVVNLFRK